MRLPRRCTPRNDIEADRPLPLLICAPRRGALSHPTAAMPAVPCPSVSCHQAQAVEKAPAARQGAKRRVKTVHRVRQARRFAPNNADGVLSAAAHEQSHDGFLDVQPILRFIKYHRLRAFNYIISNFFTPVSRQAMKDNSIFVSYS